MSRKLNLWSSGCLLVLLFVMFVSTAGAQTFSSGSNGSDGALTLTTPGTYIFNPDDVATFGRVLDPDRDYIYHFTTINIAAGVTLKLSGKILNGPVYWLATGSVQIAGNINLDGEDGQVATSLATRVPSIPGPGGYGGGLGAFASAGGQVGNGPGGSANRLVCPDGGGGTVSGVGSGGTNTANGFLVPLIGGSGGGSSGGAGGGALLLASSISINVAGLISARGGKGVSGGGAGGSIRLVAPTLSGDGSVLVNGGAGASFCSQQPQHLAGKDGTVRLEAFTFNTTLPGGRATPYNTFLPSSTIPPSLNVISVAGVPVPASPTVSFQVPDVTFSSAVAVPFSIQARNIPTGTLVKLFISSENGGDQTVNSSPLQCTQQQCTATATATLPPGYSTAYVKANWTQ